MGRSGSRPNRGTEWRAKGEDLREEDPIQFLSRISFKSDFMVAMDFAHSTLKGPLFSYKKEDGSGRITNIRSEDRAGRRATISRLLLMYEQHHAD